MKISLSWLRQFTSINLSVDELVEKIGAQLGAVEQVIDIGQKYQGIVIARVVACEKHPNADKLFVCTIDDGGITPDINRGENGYITVVCGAQNVREGLLVAWLPPGSTVPSSYDKDPFVLEARELRGVVSNGMLASAHELAFGDDHSGIVEIDMDATPGTAFAEAYELNDHVIDIENKMFTHRPDCFGVLGVAREIAGIQNIQFTSPEWYLRPPDRINPGEHKLPLEVRNDAGELVPRMMAVAMADVQIGPSPLIIQSYLLRVGLRPINNIVDITNYLMLLTAQPLHAYDYDKVLAMDEGVDTATLVARKPQEGEKITLLNGKTIEPRSESVLIASATKPIGIGGVMGGGDTEVDASTKNIIIECATFDMYSIRRTAMEHGLFTDAVTRFNKGQSPHQNDRVLEEAVSMIQSLAHGKVASEVMDVKQNLEEPVSITTKAEFINTRLGLNLDAEAMAQMLRNVEFNAHTEGDSLTVTAPFWRTDINIAEDIVEEIGRLTGFDKLSISLPIRAITPVKPDDMLSLKSRIRDILESGGANEALTYSFVHGNLLDKVGQNKDQAFSLSNAISPELQYYRLSLIPSLLEKVHANIKSGYDKFALFELNKVHNKLHANDDNGQPSEFNMVSLVYTASDKVAGSQSGAVYYQVRKYLDYLAEQLGMAFNYQIIAEDIDLPVMHPYDQRRSALVTVADTDEVLGVVGELRPAVKKALKLPAYTAGFDLSVDALLTAISNVNQAYQPLSRFPKVTQDISLRVAAGTSYYALYDVLKKKLQEIQPNRTYAQLTPLDIYQKSLDDDVKQMAFRISLASFERTMTDMEVNTLLDGLAEAAKATLNAERI